MFAGGALGAFVKDLVIDGCIAMPELKEKNLYLGFLGGAIIGGFVGFAVDGSFLTAAMGGYTGSSLITKLSLASTQKGIDNKKEEMGFTEKALEILRFLGIEDLKDDVAKNLSYGHQRVIALGMALMLAPALLMLDEPVCGMNIQETKNMMSRIREIREKRGVTIFLVEHNVKAVMDICDHITVLNFGMKIAEGTPEEIRTNPAVIEAYLGAEGYVA